MAKLETLRDNFPGNSVDLTRWGVNDVSVSNNRATFTLATQGLIGTLASTATFDALDSSIFARLIPTTLPPGGGGPGANLSIRAVAGSSSGEHWFAESVVAQVYGTPAQESIQLNTTNTSSFDQIALQYSRTDHAYIRIRIGATRAYLDTSKDGIAWVNRGSIIHGLTTFTMHARIEYYNIYGDPASVENVNVQPSGGQFFQFFN